MDSILRSVKKMLGVADGDNFFDEELIMYINSAFAVLTQLGVGPAEGFSIQDESSVWTDFVSDMTIVELTKSYMKLKVRLLFDPPTSSSVMDSINRMISEYEWRLNVQAYREEDQNE